MKTQTAKALADGWSELQWGKNFVMFMAMNIDIVAFWVLRLCTGKYILIRDIYCLKMEAVCFSETFIPTDLLFHLPYAV